MRLFGRKRKKSVYQVEMDRLLAIRLSLDPVEDAERYDDINRRIEALQKQRTTNIMNGRRWTPEGRRTFGTIIAGLSMAGFNWWFEGKQGMLTGRRAKDVDTIYNVAYRSIMNFFSKGG